jgi:gamma-glutamyltranspeptidase/glutathione hydrolase
MFYTSRALQGMTTAPHRLASEAGLRVLRDGGNAVEAMLAMAATVAVVYPHMNGLGGDGFWLISAPGRKVQGIEASGRAVVGPDWYAQRGLTEVPTRGVDAINMVAGTVDGWRLAKAEAEALGGALPWARLLEDAQFHAATGIVVTDTQTKNTTLKLAELKDQPGFAQVFLNPDGSVPTPGTILKQSALAETLSAIATDGPDSYYRGALARKIAADHERVGTPITLAALEAYRARLVEPLRIDHSKAEIYNMTAPTQGLASLIALGVADRLGLDKTGADTVAYYHGMVEAIKQAFLVRDRVVGDPDAMTEDPASFLTPAALDAMAARVDRARALPWPQPVKHGDTIWMGAVDGNGVAVSFIQSLYWEFGSGVTLQDTGLVWQNRGSAFQLSGGGPRLLAPGRKPFHTLNPPLARLKDGGVLTYGCMGGEGQPQTQAAIFTRAIVHGQDPQTAVTAPRWLLGRAWGAQSFSLKFESRVDPAIISALKGMGHDVEVQGPFEDTMGHAGMIRRHPNGLLEGANDPRSDGVAAGF